MTKEGKVYVVGGVVVVGTALLLAFWSLVIWLFWGSMAGIALWGLFRAWHAWQRNRATTQMMQAELALKREEVATAKARRHLIPEAYIGALLANPADAPRYHVWTFRQEVSPAVVTMKEEPEPLLEAPALPAARSAYDALPLLESARGRILLGYDSAGPLWLDLADLLSVAMAGNSGRGKSKALLWLTLQLLKQGVETFILDGKGDLRRWLGSYHAVAYQPGEISQMVDNLMAEANWRLRAASEDITANFAPILVVLDELDLVAGRCARAIDLIELLTKKTRSVNIHGIYSNQSVPADLVGGVATRGVIVSRICLYCDDEAARLIGVRANNGASALLQQLAPPAPAGLAVARTAAFGWKIISFPYVADSAIAHLLPPTLPPLPMKPSLSLSPEPPIVLKVPSVEERERERIIEAIGAHPDWSNARVAQALGFRNNNKLSLIKALREEAINGA